GRNNRGDAADVPMDSRQYAHGECTVAAGKRDAVCVQQLERRRSAVAQYYGSVDTYHVHGELRYAVSVDDIGECWDREHHGEPGIGERLLCSRSGGAVDWSGR